MSVKYKMGWVKRKKLAQKMDYLINEYLIAIIFIRQALNKIVFYFFHSPFYFFGMALITF